MESHQPALIADDNQQNQPNASCAWFPTDRRLDVKYPSTCWYRNLHTIISNHSLTSISNHSHTFRYTDQAPVANGHFDTHPFIYSHCNLNGYTGRGEYRASAIEEILQNDLRTAI